MVRPGLAAASPFFFLRQAQEPSFDRLRNRSWKMVNPRPNYLSKIDGAFISKIVGTYLSKIVFNP